MSEKNPEVDTFLREATQWQDELRLLREMLLQTELVEELKWGQPCYTIDGKNVLIITGFKEYCCVSFFKGALLKDPHGILVQPGSNSRATRQIRFTSAEEIKAGTSDLKDYVERAIKAEQAGMQVDLAKDAKVPVVEEFQENLDSDAKLKAAFDALTPGRQRAYLLHFSGAKQSATRAARVEKYIPRILKGKGLHDCVCGHSKHMPSCDGSHKHYQ